MVNTYLVDNSPENLRELRSLLVRYQMERSVDFSLIPMRFDKPVPRLSEIVLFMLDVSDPSAVSEKAAEIRQNTGESYIVLILKKLEDILSLTLSSISPVGLLMRPLDYADVRKVIDSLEVTEAPPDSFFTFQVKARTTRVRISQILYFESRNKKVYLITPSQEYEFQRTIDSITEEMSGSFLRVHRSYLVNREAIRSIDFGTMTMTLKDNSEVPVSRTYKDAIKEAISDE